LTSFGGNRLARAAEELRASRGKLLHAERLHTVGRTTQALLERVTRQQTLMARIEARLPAARLEPYLRESLENALEMGRAIRASLEDMQTMVAGHEVAASRPVVQELDPLVERAGRMFRMESLLRRRNFSVRCASGARVAMDPHRLVHVLMNLVRNAAQATGPGDSVVLCTRQEGDRAVVEVQDTGQGIPLKLQDKVMQAFFTTKGSAGTGLGLMMCKRAVEAHGGGLSFESTPGRGTCFRVTLPLA